MEGRGFVEGEGGVRFHSIQGVREGWRRWFDTLYSFTKMDELVFDTVNNKKSIRKLVDFF